MSEPIKYKLMPFPPTEEMSRAGINSRMKLVSLIYKAMWEAAPSLEGETPETDNLRQFLISAEEAHHYPKWDDVEKMANLARKLERERNALLAKVNQ